MSVEDIRAVMMLAGGILGFMAAALGFITSRLKDADTPEAKGKVYKCIG